MAAHTENSDLIYRAMFQPVGPTTDARTFGASLRSRHRVARITLTLGLAAVFFAVAPRLASASVAPAPGWQIESVAEPTNFAPGDTSGHDIYVVTATNSGAREASGSSAVITDTLPAGLKAKSVEFFDASLQENSIGGLNLAPYGACPTLLKCEFPGPVLEGFGLHLELQPNQKLQMVVHVEVESTAHGSVTNEAEISGGGAQSVSTKAQNEISPEPTPFGVQESTSVTSVNGSPFTQAGGHPYEMTTTANLNTEFSSSSNRFSPAENFASPEEVKDVTVNFPAGLIGNPQFGNPPGASLCSAADFGLGHCPLASQVGTLSLGSAVIANGVVALYNLVPGPGEAAEFGYRPPGVGLGQVITASVRTGGDYGQRTLSANLATVGLRYISFTLWGDPAEALHNRERGCETGNLLGCPAKGGGASGAEEAPFLSMPSSCSSGPLTSSVTVDGWNLKADQTSTFHLPPVDGCNQVHFEPEIEARPTTNLADSPSGLSFGLKVPQENTPDGNAVANLKSAAITLPEGVKVNPASANGLGACTEAEVDLHGEGPANCPETSKLGTVELDTPLLDHPMPGNIYLAKPKENPFGSLLAIYVAVDDPISGVIIKLAGKVTPNPQSGQLTVSFEENPQQPFEDLKLNLFGGAQAALRTPATCGTYETTSQLTPWSAPESGPPATPSDEFAISSGPNGGACAHNLSEEENKPRFLAGTEAPQGGTYSPLSVRLVREDGSQEVKEIEATLPAGLTGKLAGIPYCPQAEIEAARHTTGAAEQASPSCPAGSEVGTVSVGAGAGPDPYYVSGHAYLAGPYQGAPLSLVIITPALAGPFDLGDVVVQAALHVNPETTQIQVTSGPIPTILEGIPLDLRSITLNANRSNFTLNPTSCDEMSFSGAETSVLDQIAPLSQRFQVANCAGLPFSPKLALKLSGSTKHTGNPALTATLTAKPGEANLSSAQVTLPPSEFLDNAHIKDPCLRGQFAAGTCPAGSLLGHATAKTPLLEKPLEGPVYLVTGYGHLLPDVVADLGGQIQVVLNGTVTSIHGGITNTFEAVPDAPISEFTLELSGGAKGLLENSKNLCTTTNLATVKLSGQNGKLSNTKPLVTNTCKKVKKHRKRARG